MGRECGGWDQRCAANVGDIAVERLKPFANVLPAAEASPGTPDTCGHTLGAHFLIPLEDTGFLNLAQSCHGLLDPDPEPVLGDSVRWAGQVESVILGRRSPVA
jgi:hypothetical protein